MAKHEVTFPVSDPQEILKLRAGDEVAVQGHIIGIRDRTQIRIFDEGVEPPMDLRGAFLLHTAPGVRKRDDQGAARGAERQEQRASPAVPSEMTGRPVPNPAIGAAALETTQIEEIEEVAWEELMPECLWKFRVRDFGPLTVGIDAHGNSLYHDVQAAAREKLKELYAKL